MSDDLIEVWITKYALTEGIQKAQASVCGNNGRLVRAVQSGGTTGFFHGEDWHRTETAARERAEEMRAAKIKSLETQLAKLRALTF